MRFAPIQMNQALRPIQVPRAQDFDSQYSLTNPDGTPNQAPGQQPSLTNPAGGGEQDDSIGHKFMQFMKMLGGFGG